MKYIGVDVGGTGIKAGIVDEKGNVLVKDSIRTRASESYHILAQDIVSISKSVADKCGCTLEDFDSIGIGIPGSVDDKNGIVVYANNLNLLNAPLSAAVAELSGLKVYLGNDANCAALGEFFALNDSKLQNLVAVTLGTGVGGGIIINRKIYTGFNGTAGEIGHIMLKADGEPCTCGRHGCWETYASVTALVRETEKAAEQNPDSMLSKLIKANGGKVNGKTAFLAAEHNDEAGVKVVENFTRYVAEGIVDVINIFQPEVVVVGGGISKEGDKLLEPVREYVYKYIYGAEAGVEKPEIRLAQLGNDAGIVGAAFLAV